MPRLNEEWVVYEHGPVQQVDPGLLTVEGTIRMPLGRFPRRMTIVGLESGGSAVWSPISLNPAGMGKVESLGAPRFLIVPNAHHRLDLRAWKKRYPAARVIAPDGARDEVGKASPVDGGPDTLRDSRAELVTVAGTADSELALRFVHNGQLTLVVNDVIARVAHPPGLTAKLMARLMGFGVHEPQIPAVVKRVLVRDPEALAAQFKEWAADPALRRIIPSHGEILDDPAPALRKLSESLRNSK